LRAAEVDGFGEVEASIGIGSFARVLDQRLGAGDDFHYLLRDLGWRARFISSARSSISSPAFSEALRIAVIRARARSGRFEQRR